MSDTRARAPQLIECTKRDSKGVRCRRLAMLTGGTYEMLELVNGRRRDFTLHAARCPRHGIIMDTRAAIHEEPPAIEMRR